MRDKTSNFLLNLHAFVCRIKNKKFQPIVEKKNISKKYVLTQKGNF